MKNEEVFKCFMKSLDANGLNVRTDGLKVFSYNLCIGYTDKDGKKKVYDYTAPSGNFRSHTTSKHVNDLEILGAVKEKPV